MVQQLVTSDTVPPPAPEEEQCEHEGCVRKATQAYRWAWGATGKVCDEHAMLLQQTAESLNRSIVLHPLTPAAPPPLTRDERTQLVARTLVLEEEVKEAKAAGLGYYRHNGELQVQLNTAIVKERESKAQADDLRVRLLEAQQINDQLSNENATMLVELERLRSLETLVAERDAAERTELGLGPNTVDG